MFDGEDDASDGEVPESASTPQMLS
jgi:hypothetical protein